MEHARELARAARATRGEIAAAMGGDGLTGAVAGELRAPTACSASSPAAAATTSPASSASASDPVAPRS